jgi:hypothetical protein
MILPQFDHPYMSGGFNTMHRKAEKADLARLNRVVNSRQRSIISTAKALDIR